MPIRRLLARQDRHHERVRRHRPFLLAVARPHPRPAHDRTPGGVEGGVGRLDIPTYLTPAPAAVKPIGTVRHRRRAPRRGCQISPRLPATVGFGLALLIVGAARVAVGAHWPSDVLGAVLLVAIGLQLAWRLAPQSHGATNPPPTVARRRRLP